jgi:predicted Zn-dependent protease
LLLFKCSPAPIHPTAAPAASPDQRPSPCAKADAEERVREQQLKAEIGLLLSELKEHPEDAERWARLGKAYGYADNASVRIPEPLERLFRRHLSSDSETT